MLHFANDGACTWRDYAQFALETCAAEGISLKTTEVAPLTLEDMPSFIARRPIYTVLSTARYADISGHAPRPWREAVAEYVRDHVTP